jgi:RNA-directed DNA polymerase
MGRVVESFNPNERLLERILSKETLETAWKLVKTNHGAPGVGGISIEQFPDHTRELWPGIRQSLLPVTYQPSPVRRVEIPKPTGGTRPLAIPTVLDRLIQQAIAQARCCLRSLIRGFRNQASGSDPDGPPIMRFTGAG